MNEETPMAAPTTLATPVAGLAPSRPDPMMLQWGRDLAERHRADPTDASRCGNPQCGVAASYPCRVRRIADRLIAASQAGWPHLWTARIDALSCGATPARVMPAASTAAPMPGRDR
jgi:hypothetical protein